jgi:hypothetical protein
VADVAGSGRPGVRDLEARLLELLGPDHRYPRRPAADMIDDRLYLQLGAWCDRRAGRDLGVLRPRAQAGGELGEPGLQLTFHPLGIDVDDKRVPGVRRQGTGMAGPEQDSVAGRPLGADRGRFRRDRTRRLPGLLGLGFHRCSCLGRRPGKVVRPDDGLPAAVRLPGHGGGEFPGLVGRVDQDDVHGQAVPGAFLRGLPRFFRVRQAIGDQQDPVGLWQARRQGRVPGRGDLRPRTVQRRRDIGTAARAEPPQRRFEAGMIACQSPVQKTGRAGEAVQGDVRTGRQARQLDQDAFHRGLQLDRLLRPAVPERDLFRRLPESLAHRA